MNIDVLRRLYLEASFDHTVNKWDLAAARRKADETRSSKLTDEFVFAHNAQKEAIEKLADTHYQLDFLRAQMVAYATANELEK